MNDKDAFRLLQIREAEKKKMLEKLPRADRKERKIIRKAVNDGTWGHDGAW